MSATRPAERTERVGVPSPFGMARALGRVRSDLKEAAAPPVEEVDRNLEAARARSGLAGSAARIAGAMQTACVEHEAEPGRPCFASERSRVVGFCGNRWAAGTARAAREVGGWR